MNDDDDMVMINIIRKKLYILRFSIKFRFKFRVRRKLFLMCIRVQLLPLFRLAFFFFGVVRSFPSVYVQRPYESELIPLGHDIVVNCDIFEPPLEEYELCIAITSKSSMAKTVEMTCSASYLKGLTLHNVPADKYLLEVVLRLRHSQALIFESKNQREFSIVDTTPRFPTIKFGQILYQAMTPKDTANSTATLKVDFLLGQTFMPLDKFDLCVKVVSVPIIVGVAAEDVILPLTCLPNDHKDLTLSRIPPGSHKLSMFIRDKRSMSILMDSEATTSLNVVTLSSAMPKILVHNTHDAVVDPIHNTASVRVDFGVDGIPAALDQVLLCANLTHPATSLVLSSTVCLSSRSNNLALSKLPEGLNVLQLILRNAENTELFYPNTHVSVAIDARRTEEFVPSYEWRELRAWHTIPSGIETR